MSAHAQRVLSYSTDELAVAQAKRVDAALEKLAPLQVAGCWLSPRVLPLFGLSEIESVGNKVDRPMAEAGTPFSKVQPRDLPVSIDGEAIKQGGSGDQVAVVKARQAPFRQFLVSEKRIAI